MMDVKIHIRIIKSECGLGLTVCYLSGDFHDIVIERAPYVVKIAEYEGFFEVEPNSDDIARILSCECHGLFGFKLMLEQEFFVVWTAFV